MNRRFLRLWILGLTCSFLIGSLTPARFVSASANLTTGWTTRGTQIGYLDTMTSQFTPFTITGINWYGFETTGYVAHGLYSQNYKSVLDQIKKYGYNTVRIPFSNQMWEANPIPKPNTISACPECKGKHARDILALIVNYAGSIGLHVILDNHRSTAGNGPESNGLWYVTSGGKNYSESAWTRDWRSVQQWVHGVRQSLGFQDTVSAMYQWPGRPPTVLGYDLRNEPHTPSRTAYLKGATWGTGDGTGSANPNPFSPDCVQKSSCRDWRLAAERAGDWLLGDAANNTWSYPLIFVEGIGQYPTDGGAADTGPYDYYWWGGQLQGVNGNSTNPGAPIVLNAHVNDSSLGEPVYNQLVYSAHDYGPSLYKQGYFNSSTCYQSGCSASSLADVWTNHWAYVNLRDGINPWPRDGSYPWAETGHSAYTQAPIYIGEFGTGNTSADVHTTGPGSQGQWFTDLVNFVESSYHAPGTTPNYSGVPVTSLNWTYWAVNGEDGYGLLKKSYSALAYPTKEYSFLCFIQQAPGANDCGSTGPLPPPN